jgi:hypothetical protein
VAQVSGLCGFGKHRPEVCATVAAPGTVTTEPERFGSFAGKWQRRPRRILSLCLVEIRLDTKERTNNHFAVMANSPSFSKVA